MFKVIKSQKALRKVGMLQRHPSKPFWLALFRGRDLIYDVVGSRAKGQAVFKRGLMVSMLGAS